MRRRAIVWVLVALATSARAEAQGRPPGDAVARAALATRLREKGAAAVPLLIDLLDDEDSRVRLAAVHSLHALRAREAMRPLLVRAQVDGDERVRLAAARAVREVDPRRYVSALGSADPPPVQPFQPPPVRARWEAAPRALIAELGLLANQRDFTSSVGGSTAIGLRWPYVETRLSLSWPALSLGLQARVNLLPHLMLVPYAALGMIASFQNGVEPGWATLSLYAGGGLRLRATRRVYFFGELGAAWLALYSKPAVDETPGRLTRIKQGRVAVPVLFGAGLELWP